MGRTHLNTIVPTRFLTTIGHLIVVLMINYTYEANIRASLRINYSQAEWDSAETSIQWCQALSIIMLCVELLGLFLGVSLFLPFIQSFDIFAHFIATCLLSWFIIDAWHYDWLWVVWFFLEFFPFLLEIYAFLRRFKFKISQY